MSGIDKVVCTMNLAGLDLEYSSWRQMETKLCASSA